MNYREIVLVEDSLDEQLLSLNGIRKGDLSSHVLICRDGESAIALLLDASRQPPALVVLDYHLPKLSGLEVLMALRSVPRTRTVPIVIVSCALTDAEIRECYEHGANCCMIKSSDVAQYVDEITLMVRQWLNAADSAEPSPEHSELPRLALPDLPPVPYSQAPFHSSAAPR
jgi:CheY-like chemotaxis protein